MDANAEIAASLTMDEIPVKLRCAACNRLANNAFRTPCCDQSICEDCQASLPEACPVCLHEPVKADDCRPNKGLRTTIKVFLKKKILERASARKMEMLEKAAATPASVAPEVLPEKFQDSHDQHQTIRLSKGDSTQTAGDGTNGMEKGEENEKALGQEDDLAQEMENGFWINNLPNMGFIPFFPNMMGIPGFSLDPFSGQGTGMNGMNMGMRFDAGQGAFGGFNGQPAAWNAGQNHTYADFGANTGYGGYNMPPHQGNFNQMDHYQYPNNDSYHGLQQRNQGMAPGDADTARATKTPDRVETKVDTQFISSNGQDPPENSRQEQNPGTDHSVHADDLPNLEVHSSQYAPTKPKVFTRPVSSDEDPAAGFSFSKANPPVLDFNRKPKQAPQASTSEAPRLSPASKANTSSREPPHTTTISSDTDNVEATNLLAPLVECERLITKPRTASLPAAAPLPGSRTLAPALSADETLVGPRCAEQSEPVYQSRSSQQLHSNENHPVAVNSTSQNPMVTFLIKGSSAVAKRGASVANIDDSTSIAPPKRRCSRKTTKVDEQMSH